VCFGCRLNLFGRVQAYGPEGLGALTVSGVPEYVELRKKLLPLAADFAVSLYNLDTEKRRAALCLQVLEPTA
jgi:hypothetical protein